MIARFLVAVALALLAAAGVPPSATAAESGTPTQTVVTLTFDDGWRSQLPAAEAMAARGMVGTFFIASGQVGYPAFMTVKELRDLQSAGHEIGGHTLSHPRLTEMPLDKARHQVCSDRTGLLQLGLQVTSFAYPYGDHNRAVRRLPQECGYNSARLGWGLYSGRDRCSFCLTAESLRVYDPWSVRPVAPHLFVGKQALPQLKRAVLDAEVRGDWLPLVFHHVCAPKCKDPGIALSDLEKFLDWLGARAPTTVVRSVEQVVSGSVQPAVGPPPWQIGGVSLPPPDKAEKAAMAAARGVTPKQKAAILANARERRQEQALARDAAANTAFTIPSIDIGQLEVIVLFCGTAVIGVTVFRLGTRRRRYEW